MTQHRRLSPKEVNEVVDKSDRLIPNILMSAVIIHCIHDHEDPSFKEELVAHMRAARDGELILDNGKLQAVDIPEKE